MSIENSAQADVVQNYKKIPMRKIKIWEDDPSDKQLKEIADCLEGGGLIVIPTDTLYGIACSSSDVKAIEEVCRLKGIDPSKSTLSILCSDISMASEYSRFDNYAFKLLKELTPGPYTFICRTAPTLPKAFKGRKTVGVRIPKSNTARKIAAMLGKPLMTASIHYEDEDYARNPELIAEAYEGKVSMAVLGPDGDTVPSTVISCTGREPELIREGKGEYQN